MTLEGLTWELGGGDAIRAAAASDCLLAGCTVRRFAGDGVTIDGGRATGCSPATSVRMGRGGTAVSGGDRKTLTPGGHFVENCHIHDLSRIDHTYTPAVRMTGVGNRIAHNLFHDIASSAIRLGGNDHLVEFNEVHHVVLESDDQGGVDMFGNPTYRGNVYRYNYWHHIGDWQGTEPLAAGRPGRHPAGRRDLRRAGLRQRVLPLFGGHVGLRRRADPRRQGQPRRQQRLRRLHGPPSASRRGARSDGSEHVAKPEYARDIDRALYLARYPSLARLAEDHDANLLCRNVVYRCREFTAASEARTNWSTIA